MGKAKAFDQLVHLGAQCAAVLISVYPFAVSVAAPGDISLRLMASPAGFATGPSVGHAFFCIALQLNNGIKEDCYGFYPKTGGGMFVGGPGVVNSEFKKNPVRFSNVSSSLDAKITEAQRKAVLGLVNDFNTKTYSLTSANCIDFLLSVVHAAGLNAPARSRLQTPDDFVKQVKALN